MQSNRAHGNFSDILNVAGPRLRPICAALRAQIASLHTAYVEVVWPRRKTASFGVGPRQMTQHYAYLAVHGSYVNLGFYRGASMADPEGILEGAGRKLRHIKIRDVAAAKSPAIARLLRQAIAERLQNERCA